MVFFFYNSQTTQDTGLPLCCKNISLGVQTLNCAPDPKTDHVQLVLCVIWCDSLHQPIHLWGSKSKDLIFQEYHSLQVSHHQDEDTGDRCRTSDMTENNLLCL